MSGNGEGFARTRLGNDSEMMAALLRRCCLPLAPSFILERGRRTFS